MKKLDDYSLLHIFQYLRAKDKLSASKVCVQWHNVLTAYSIVQELTVKFNYNANNISDLNPNDFQEIIKLCSHGLKNISLMFSSLNKDNKHMIVYFDNCKYRTVNFSLFAILDLLATFCHNIKTLTVDNIGTAKENSENLFDNFLNSNRELVGFFLESFDENPGYFDNIINLNKLPTSLEELSLCNIHYSTENILCSFLEKASNLKLLTLISCNYMTNKSLQIISEVSQNLDNLTFFIGYNHDIFIDIDSVKCISKLINLELLALSNFHGSITDDIIIEIASCCKKIRSLYLHNCLDITNKGLNNLVSNYLPELQELSLIRFNISELPICLKLKLLSLTDCTNLPEDVLLQVLKIMPNLTFFEINYCLEYIYEKLICDNLSITISRQLDFVISEETFSAEKEKQIMVRYSKSTPINKNNVFYMTCLPKLVNLRKILEDYIQNTIPTCEMLYIIGTSNDYLTIY